METEKTFWAADGQKFNKKDRQSFKLYVSLIIIHTNYSFFFFFFPKVFEDLESLLKQKDPLDNIDEAEHVLPEENLNVQVEENGKVKVITLYMLLLITITCVLVI